MCDLSHPRIIVLVSKLRGISGVSVAPDTNIYCRIQQSIVQDLLRIIMSVYENLDFCNLFSFLKIKLFRLVLKSKFLRRVLTIFLFQWVKLSKISFQHYIHTTQLFLCISVTRTSQRSISDHVKDGKGVI